MIEGCLVKISEIRTKSAATCLPCLLHEIAFGKNWQQAKKITIFFATFIAFWD